MKDTTWQSDEKTRAIKAYVEWHRVRYGIVVGTPQQDNQNLGTYGQLLENLSREHFPTGHWEIALSNESDRDLAYAGCCASVRFWQGRCVSVMGWEEPLWQTTADVVEVVCYVTEFREAHRCNMENLRDDFKIDDLKTEGRFIIGKLVPAPDFSGPWSKLRSADFASKCAECVRDVLRARLEQYKARKRPAVA